MTPTVLFICHNHPKVRPGGAEAYAYELHRHFAQSDEVESVFLAKGGPPMSNAGSAHLGSYIAPAGKEADEYFCFTWDYDWIFGTTPNKLLYTKHIRAFLKALRPDIVHLHHTMFFGYDVLREIRNTLPDTPIVYTLHEFMPICHRQGQMLRVIDDKPCLEESPRRCHECFPEISQQTFFMRKRFIQAQFALVDRFIAPSEFLGQRYVDWGIPEDKIIVEEYGRTPPPGSLSDDDRPLRDRFGFFGQLTPFKGLQVVLEAAALLQAEPRGSDDPLLAALERAVGGDASHSTGASRADASQIRFRIHGANLDLQPGEFQNRIKALLHETRETVTHIGRYSHDSLAAHMAEVDWVIVPSIWWENSPLVIQEAFHFGRPIICSDIGGMAEKVTDGVNGLHFRAGDPTSLAATIRRAAEDPALWRRLKDQIPPTYRMETHAVKLLSLYRHLLDERAVRHAA